MTKTAIIKIIRGLIILVIFWISAVAIGMLLTQNETWFPNTKNMLLFLLFTIFASILILDIENKFKYFKGGNRGYIIYLVPIFATLIIWYVLINFIPLSLNETIRMSSSEKFFVLILLFAYYIFVLFGSILFIRVFFLPPVFCTIVRLVYNTIEFWHKLQLKEKRNKITVLASSVQIEKNISWSFLYFVCELSLLYLAISSIFFNYAFYKKDLSKETLYFLLENINYCFLFFLIVFFSLFFVFILQVLLIKTIIWGLQYFTNYYQSQHLYFLCGY